MQKTMLKFKVETTEELITPNSGLTLYLELYRAAKVNKSVRDLFPKPGSAKGFQANVYVLSILMLFLSGGKYIEDIRKLKLDKALKKVGKIGTIPSADAIGDWMRTNSEDKIKAIEHVNKKLSRRFLKKIMRKEHTLDIDAFSIFSGKDTALHTYKGPKGYMPIVGHLAELDWCIGYDFREGNVPPAKANLEFLQSCFRNMPKGHKIKKVRIDSAGYQAEIFNWLDKKNVKFTVTAAKKGTILPEVHLIPEKDWKPWKDKNGFPTDRMYAETWAQMDKTDYFRIIVQRWPNPKQNLFEKASEYCYYIIATNYSEEEKSARDVVLWHNQRGNSENYYKEKKYGFNLNYLPCDDFQANAFWFSMGIMAYNFHVFSKEYMLPVSWRQHTIQTVRWKLIHIAGKVVKHARNVYLKLAGISSDLLEIFNTARQRCWEVAFSP